mmetsp:Transcript_72517/g.143801  ORF Transcript_72517/g.143801 Transcript_72517/m.143801 type:complete len:452 (+) Transcript_72517:55-1410(+)
MACGPTMQDCRSPDGRPERRRAAMADSATLENQCHPRKIFIGGLAHKTTTQQLRDYFSRYGAIVDAVVLRWPDGRSRGFGYVTFSDTAAVAAALRVSHQVGGRHIDVKRAVPGTNKLFVGGLPQNTAATELREHFEAFGVVSDAVVMIDPVTGRSRGFGFVCYLPGQEGAAAVAAALEQYNNHRIRGKWIEVKSAASPHKLAAKEGPSDSHEGASASASTAAGTCDELQVADSESESASLNNGPVVNARPVASPHGRRSVPSKAHQLPGQMSYVGPCKVSLPRATAATKQQSVFATMGTPPGLGVPSRATDLLPDFHAEFSLLPRQAPWPHARTGLMPWSASCMPVISTSRDMLSSEPVSAQPAAQQWWSSFDSAHAQPTVNSDPSDWGSPFLQDSSSLFATRHSLQKSLEQLLKQQCLRAAGEKTESGSTDIRASAVVSPEETAIHTGPR